MTYRPHRIVLCGSVRSLAGNTNGGLAGLFTVNETVRTRKSDRLTSHWNASLLRVDLNQPIRLGQVRLRAADRPELPRAVLVRLPDPGVDTRDRPIRRPRGARHTRPGHTDRGCDQHRRAEQTGRQRERQPEAPEPRPPRAQQSRENQQPDDRCVKQRLHVAGRGRTHSERPEGRQQR